ncbi:lysine-rich arabinogalactan protein 17-like [Sorghum bicolor]|uniref:lysine-rich arabinogalactan protein 17-like n=1 Tax=Sorghum bicolor TaxID=4558 RepID=UPI000B425C92|nr:lysine-rich arabinogalactan protein 17-like [Sorghum bicolor]|eukprot:XP_021303818.1 lysine-rich arabinogalactan protein 17-like [Sorghum bicolor]
MAASGIQIPQIQLPSTSTIRPPTPAPQTQSQSQQPLQLPAQSQPFSTPQHQAPAAFTAPVTTTERLSSSVVSSKQLAPSSTVPETSPTATEFVPASSAGLEQPAQPVIAPAPTEQTRTASPARAASEGHSTSSASTADSSNDAARFKAVPRDSTASPPPPTS